MGSGSADHENIDKHVKIYMMVFAALMVLTIVTVAVSYLDLSTAGTITLALVIATIKGSLVACYFMHLISEKKLIYTVLIFTAFFFLMMLLGPVLTDIDAIAVEG